MKKLYVILSLFAMTLFIGGTDITRAWTKSEPLINFHADFAGSPHESAQMTKDTLSGQRVLATKTTEDRYIQLSLWLRVNDNKATDQVVSGQNWKDIHTGDDIYLMQSSAVPTEGGERYLLKIKLKLPWFQTDLNGTWVIDQ